MQGGQLSQISAPNIQLKCAWRCTINVPLCLKGLSDIHTFLFSDCGQPCSGLLTQHFDIHPQGVSPSVEGLLLSRHKPKLKALF